MALAVIAALIVGCGGGTTKPTTTTQISNSTTSPKGQTSSTALFTITADSMGPLTGQTPANLAALRELLGKDGFDVQPVTNNGVEFHVFRKDELLFRVITNDDGSLFNVHVVSGKIEIAEHPQWKIGAAFVGDDVLTTCECWGAHPVCFKTGDHVAVAFKRACDGLDDARMRKVLAGVTVERAVWSPTPFGVEASGSSDPCGGRTSGERDPGRRRSVRWSVT